MNTVPIPPNLIKKLQQLNQRLLGYNSPTFEKQIIDIYVTPNQWFFAKDVLRLREFDRGYPLLASDDLTIVVAFVDRDIEEVWRIVNEDDLEDLKEVVADLPRMIDRKEEWEIGDSRVKD